MTDDMVVDGDELEAIAEEDVSSFLMHEVDGELHEFKITYNGKIQ